MWFSDPPGDSVSMLEVEFYRSRDGVRETGRAWNVGRENFWDKLMRTWIGKTKSSETLLTLLGSQALPCPCTCPVSPCARWTVMSPLLLVCSVLPGEKGTGALGRAMHAA